METSNGATPTTRPGLAVCLGSSFLGFYAHSSFMAELDAAGIGAGQLAGTSSGALVAVARGAGVKGGELVKFFQERGLRRGFMDIGIVWRAAPVLFCVYGTGVMRSDGAVRWLKRRLGEPRLEDMHGPRVQIAVTEMMHGQALIVERGDACEYAVASCAVPGMFQARVVEGRRFWDGGVVNDAPFFHWREDPSVEVVVVHQIRHAEGSLRVPRWPTMATGVAMCHQTITNTLTDYRLQLMRASGKNVIVVNTITPHPGWFPGPRIREALIEAGHKAGREAVAALRALPQARAA